MTETNGFLPRAPFRSGHTARRLLSTNRYLLCRYSATRRRHILAEKSPALIRTDARFDEAAHTAH